jgi:site-specific recombinase XerD
MLDERLVEPDSPRVRDRHSELKGRRKSHRLTVASDLRNHIAPFFAGKTLDRIRPSAIERYVAAKRKTLAIKTIRNHVNTMHSIFDLGLRKGWCASNPVKLADRPTVKKTETRIQFLDQPELEQLDARKVRVVSPYVRGEFGDPKSAGVNRITFHELRHTFGTRMAAAGTPMRTLQHWMGHADSKTTQIYAHYQPSDQEADAVDRAFA